MLYSLSLLEHFLDDHDLRLDLLDFDLLCDRFISLSVDYSFHSLGLEHLMQGLFLHLLNLRGEVHHNVQLRNGKVL